MLACFFLVFAFNLGDGLLSFYGFYQRYPQLAHWEDGFPFLIGPILYFYSRSIIYRNFRFVSKDLLHTTPFVIFTLSFQIFYHVQPADYQTFIQSAIQRQQLPNAFYVSLLMVYLHVFTYLFYAFRDINAYRHQIKQRFSNVKKRNLNWLMFLIVAVVVILILSLIYSFLPLATKMFFNIGMIIVFAFIFVFINTIVWKALHQPEIFSGLDDDDKKEKYAGSGLTAAERRDCQQGLERLIKDEKIFLKADISLDELADKISISARKLSQFINEDCHQSFFDYINTFRIAEAQRIMTMSKDGKLTVLEIMYQSGFNSKSSFNTLFKKKTGQTPSAFRKATLK